MKIIRLLLFIFLWGCSNPSLSPPNTITLTLSSPVSNLNPIYATDANAAHIVELSQASLVKISSSLVPEPYLAESFKILNNNSIEFHLRSNCIFQDGTSITAEDVKRSLEYYTDPSNQSPFAEELKKIKSLEIKSPFHFILHTEKPEPSLMVNLIGFKIMPKNALGKNQKSLNPPGAGAYRVTELNTKNILLEKSNQPCLPIPASPKLAIKIIRDDLSRFLKLRKGEIDLVLNEMDYRKVETIQKNPSYGLTVVTGDGVGYKYLGVNLSKPPLNDVRVREAIALSLDVGNLIQYKARGFAVPAKSLISDLNYYANQSLKSRERDLEKAKLLLDQAGFSNGKNNKPPLKITLKTTSNSIEVENGRVLVAQAREAGIELVHRSFEWGIFYSDVKSGNTQLYLLRYVGIIDPGIYEVFHSKEIGKNNRTHYTNPEIDLWINKGQSTLDMEKRKVAFDKVQEIIARDLPFINLYHTKNVAIFRNNIKGVEVHPTGSWLPLLKARKE